MGTSLGEEITLCKKLSICHLYTGFSQGRSDQFPRILLSTNGRTDVAARQRAAIRGHGARHPSGGSHQPKERRRSTESGVWSLNADHSA